MVAQPRGPAVETDERDVERRVHQMRSKIAAIPWPPPMQSEASP